MIHGHLFGDCLGCKNKYMCRILLECLAGVLFGFLGFALGMFFGTLIFGHAGFGAMLGVIGLAYFLNIAKRIQEKRRRKQQ